MVCRLDLSPRTHRSCAAPGQIRIPSHGRDPRRPISSQIDSRRPIFPALELPLIITDMAIKLVPGGHPYHALAEAAANAAREGNINYTSGCREHHCLDRAKLRQARVREGRYLLRNQFRRGRPGQTAESLTAAGDGVGSVQEPERRPRDPAGLSPARGAHRGELSPTRRGIATASRGCLCFLRKSGSTATDDEGGPRYRRVRF